MYAIQLSRIFLRQTYLQPYFPGTGMSLQDLRASYSKYLTDLVSSHALLKAQAFDYVCRNIGFRVDLEDLFPSFAFWGRRVLFEDTLQRVWQKRVIEEKLTAVKELRDELNRRGLYIYHWDFWHSVPDWDAILGLGFPGLLKRVEEAESDFLEKHPQPTAENLEFFSSVKQEYRSAILLLDRLSQYAESHPCQPETREALAQLKVGAPKTMYQALLLVWLFFQICEYGDAIQTRSFGNLDRVLFPYYANDLKNGLITEDDARTIFGNFMLKVFSMEYKVGHPFYLGGTNEDETSSINELSYLILEEYGKLNIYDPKLQIKISPVTPKRFLDLALKLIRSGKNSIVFVGEPCIRKAMVQAGYTPDEARTADIKGCYEYASRGNAVELANIILKLPHIVREAIFDDVQYDSFEDFLDKLREKLQWVCQATIAISNESEKHYAWINPAAIFSGASKNSLKLGLDGYAKAAEHNITNIWLMGPASAANALAVIRKFVFENKEISMEELKLALDNNWQGYEKIRLKILKDNEKYGNNCDRGDDMMVWICETTAGFINGQPNARGGFYTTSLHAAEQFIIQGRTTKATADGRRDGDEFSKNASVQPGTNRKGVTAMIQSALKLDPTDYMSDFPLDIMLHPATIAGDSGLDAMRALLMNYIENYGHAIHFNVFSSEQLRNAQKNPELYSDLQVRICGWNVLWNSLSKKEQDSYILQAETLEQGA